MGNLRTLKIIAPESDRKSVIQVRSWFKGKAKPDSGSRRHDGKAKWLSLARIGPSRFLADLNLLLTTLNSAWNH